MAADSTDLTGECEAPMGQGLVLRDGSLSVWFGTASDMNLKLSSSGSPGLCSVCGL